MTRLGILVAGALALGACDTSADPPVPGLAVLADSSSYALTEDGGFIFGEVTLTMTNVGDRTRWLAQPTGDPFCLQRLTGGRWNVVWCPIYAAIGWPEPTPLLPGDRRSLSFRIYGYRDVANHAPDFDLPVGPGEYRIELQSVFLTREGTTPLSELAPLEERVSDSFVLDVPPR